MQIREVFDRKRFVFLDGGMGTQLQARGLQPGQKPELAALEMPEVLTAIHTDYANAGADILLANTFGANAKKLTGCGHTVDEVVSASIACARKAAETTGACVALDIGPLGELLVPAGTLAFEDAYNEFAQVIRAGAAAGADLVFLETMTDLYELKAAILAARENCDLPVFTSMSFESRGRTFTGCTVESYAVTAAGLGADAVGINCSLGPKEILPFAQRLCRSVPAGVPVFVKPNAGLPNPDGSYNLDPDEFAAEMKEYAAIGVSMVGGCCGTTPAEVDALRAMGIRYSRTVSNTGHFGLPQDFMLWKPTCHHNDRLLEQADKFLHTPGYEKMPLFYIWGHSFEFDRENTWDLIGQLAEKLADAKDIWYATNGQIEDYITALRSLRQSADGRLLYNPTAQTIWFTTDGKIRTVESGTMCVL